MDSTPAGRTDAPDRFVRLPERPDLDRAVAEQESRPDPVPDALALAEFNERPGG